MIEPADAATPSLARMLAEMPTWLVNPPWWGRGKVPATRRPGRGQAVLVIPGFLASDLYTIRLRNTLAAAGYEAHGWALGKNRGITQALFEALLGRIDALPAPLSLIGWSLGGLYAREVAKHRPDRIARVVTLGSPFSGDIRRNRAWKLYERLNDHPVDDPPIRVALSEKPPVPTIALWSARDGIVAPAASRGLAGETDLSVGVACRHLDFVSSPAALAAILAALETPIENAPPPPPAP